MHDKAEEEEVFAEEIFSPGEEAEYDKAEEEEEEEDDEDDEDSIDSGEEENLGDSGPYSKISTVRLGRYLLNQAKAILDKSCFGHLKGCSKNSI